MTRGRSPPPTGPLRVRDGRAAEQWRPGSAVVEQLPDSRGWVRVPRERLPELDPVPPWRRAVPIGGLLLIASSSGRNRARPAVTRRCRHPARPTYEVLAERDRPNGGLRRPDALRPTRPHPPDRDVDGGHRALRLGQVDTDLSASPGCCRRGPGRSPWATASGTDSRAVPVPSTAAVGWRCCPSGRSMLEALTVRENLQLTAGIPRSRIPRSTSRPPRR